MIEKQDVIIGLAIPSLSTYMLISIEIFRGQKYDENLQDFTPTA